MRFLIALLVCVNSYASFTFVQTKNGGNDFVTSVAAATASPAFSSGNVVDVGVGFRNTCATATSSVADDKSGGSNTYTQVGSDLDGPGGTCIRVYRSTITGTASNVTATFSTAVRFCAIIVLHYSISAGTATSYVPKTGTGTASTATSASFTTADANSIISVFMKTESAESSPFPTPTGFGSFTSVAADPYQNSFGAAYQVLSSTQSSVAVTETVSGNANIAIFVAITGDGAGGGGGGSSSAKRRILY